MGDARLGSVVAAFEAAAALHLEVAAACAAGILAAADLVTEALGSGRRVLACGNGGSAADAQHFAAELVGRFARERAAWPALALTTDTSALTAIGNDYGFERVFSRQVEAHGRNGDVLVLISTSGSSPNVLVAARTAAARGLRTVGLTGRDGGELARLVDVPLNVPAASTARVQEVHATILHVLCDLVEQALTGTPARSEA
jgi:D-sedoheptulose 7-phosphate isomerase